MQTVLLTAVISIIDYIGVQRATSEVLRGKICCASHNLQLMSAAGAAKTQDIATLKAALQQDVDKEEYIGMLKARAI